ncbi:MAG: hypothetical protein M1561_05020 [Gammaproteobacteria bacterium]|nr:hypothetical protein [Gammaproteobacteria bacterium]
MRKQMKKPLFIAAFAALLLIISASIFAVLPPKYLSVKNFKQCLGTKNMGTWSAWCMPATKPATCPDNSWKELNKLTGRDRLSNC